MKYYLKAIFGAIGGGITFAIPALTDGLTSAEWLGIFGAAFAAFQLIYWTPNADEEMPVKDLEAI